MLRLSKVAVWCLAARALSAQVDVLTAQYNNNRTSSNTQETTLTRSNVNNAQFGKLFSRTVDAPFYASPLVVTNIALPGVGTKNVVFVATLGNTIYAFDADDPAASTPYWSVHLGTPFTHTCCLLQPTVGILSTPVIDRSTNTIYLTAIIQNTDVGLYAYALDLTTGAFKFNSPRRITYTFPSGVTKTAANLPGNASWLQRSGLLLVNNILYIGTSAVWEGDTIETQEGFIQAFQANDLSVQLGSFETTPTGEGGAFWQAGRGLAADAAGDVFAVVDSGAYNPPTSFGDSVIKFSPGTVSVNDWFTPADWNALFAADLDETSGGATLIPGTNLLFTTGKAGVLYLVDQTHMGGLEPGSTFATPLQQFQATHGCGMLECSQHTAAAFWPQSSTPAAYVWDVYDTLRAYPFDPVSQRFVTASSTAATLFPSRAGGLTVSSNGNLDGIVWTTTAAQDPLNQAVPGTLRAYNANNVAQELYDSDQNSCRDSMGSFVKFSTPIVANGKVYVNTQSNTLPVYGLLSTLPATAPPAGTVHITVNTSIPGPTISVDGANPCTGAPGFDWSPGSQHSLSTVSPQIGLPGISPLAGTPGIQYVFTGWSDGGAITHSVAPTTPTTYTANFKAQYFLSLNSTPFNAGSVVASPASANGYYDSGTTVQLTATPITGCSFVNWSGSLSGAANPQSLTVSGPLSVTANFTCTVILPSSFITGFGNKVLRSDYTGWVGLKFQVGNSALKVTSLGRISVYGNSGTHQLKLVNIDGTDVPGGSTTVSMSGGSPGQFKYATLDAPVTLQPNTIYFVVSYENIGADLWYDFGPVSSTADGTALNPIYSVDSSTWLLDYDSGDSYVPVSFLYTLDTSTQYQLSTGVYPSAGGSVTANPPSSTGSYTVGSVVQLTAAPAQGCTFINWTGALTGVANPQSVTMSGPQSVTANFQCGSSSAISFVTGVALANQPLRHDFSGWVGMKLTVGSNPLSISSLGRICISGSSQSHTVKLVNPGDGTDVPNASALVNMAGCAAGTYAYTGINPITLPAGSSYYLVSQEFYAGDQWYDVGKISATSDATINSGVYAFNGAWITIGGGNNSYVPPTFQYTAVLPSTVAATVQASPAGAAFTVDGTSYTTAQTFAWTSGASHSLSVTSPQSTGTGTQLVWSSWSDGGAISHSVAPTAAAGYTATFTTQYLLSTNVSPAGGGSISTNGYFNAGSSVQLTATPAANCTFTSWSGALAGSVNPQPVTMSGPLSVTANFQCSGPTASAFVTAFGTNKPTLRTDFSGFVGMKFTVASVPLNVVALGRVCVAGNSNSHTVKLVNPADGSDLTSVTVNMAGCTAGQFVYAALTPVTLPAGASYYLVSQESAGGDTWYDSSVITSTNAAAVISSVYLYNGSWYSLGGGNTSYVPPNMQYTSVVAAPISATVQTNPSAAFSVDGSSYTGSQTLTWSSGTSHTLSTASPQNSGVGTQLVWTSWSDGGALSHTVSPTSNTTYTANFATQYLLTSNVSPVGSGSITTSPASSAGYFNSGASVQLTATPAAGCTFTGWTGALTGSTNPQSITMSSPQTVTATFQCTGPTATTFVTNYGTTNPSLRNDFSGWVGMKMTVGATPLTISALGRVCVAGNTQSHTVKFVNVSDGSDVPGATAQINMAGCTAGQFAYSTVTGASLAANSSYYLVSQETLGGDRWYDSGTIAATNAATVASSVYLYDGNWYPLGGGSTSYVPPNFQYTTVTPSPISISVQANPSGPSFSVDGATFTTPQNLTWTAGAAHTIATTSPQSTGTGTQVVFNGWSDGGAISHAVAPTASATYTASFTTQYLLTSSVLPAGGGSVVASPSSSTGYYNAGGTVQLTATPASGCTFLNWTGALTGTTNPQTVTMSSPQSVTANFQCTGPTASTFVTGYGSSNPPLRNDFSGWVGMKLTVGANPLVVSTIGRICVAGNTQSHTVKFVNTSDGSDVLGATALVNMSGCTPGQFTFTAITPIALAAGASYYLVSQEVAGNDRWYDFGAISATSAAVVNNSVYSYNGGWLPIGQGNTSYVPANFQYTVVTPTPISVSVQTSPSGVSYTVDGSNYTAAQTFTWTSGSSHSVATTSPQTSGAGTQNVFVSWSDGGALSHAISPTGNVTYTATFTTQYLLTTNVSPAGGGSILASPASANSYFNAGSAIQLTAAPASGCTFLNWSGALTGNTNPQTVTMSAPQTVTASFQCSGPAATNFVTAYGLSNTTLRNDFTGWVGMKVSIVGNPMTVSALGRICVAGNSQSHAVKLANASDGSDVPGALATVSMANCAPGQFVFSSITPVTLPAGTSFYLVSQETQGGDKWYDQGTISTTNAGVTNSAVYSWTGNWITIGSANSSYVPPNMQYSSSSSGGGAPSTLAGYWSFDPSYVSGTTLVDQSNYANNATAYSLTFVPGKIGQAIGLDGSSSRAEVVSGTHLDLLNDITLAAWIKTTNSSRTEAILSKYDAGGIETGYILRTTPAGVAEMQFGGNNIVSGNNVVTDATKINDGQWHHIAAVINLGSYVSFYIDGVPSSTTALATQALAASPDFEIGVNPYTYYGNYFTGTIDEVRIYSRALAAAEIFGIYNSIATPTGTPVVSITSPSSSSLSGVVTLSANAADSTGIFYVQFQLDGIGILPGLSTSPYSVSWDSTRATSGPHTLTAVAMNTTGKIATSSPLAVTISNPPILASGLPSGLWPAGTNQLTLSLTSNENATCRYSTTAGTAYSAMTATFATTGGTSHSTTVSGLQNGQTYYFYVRCQDGFGNTNTTDFSIQFSIAAANISNGLAQTPPMGWNSWNYFREQISDTLIRQIADSMVSTGMSAAGYTYVVIDGGWEGQRDANGALQGNANFPNMKALADYVHSKGLKLGIYSSPGPTTCDSLPGSYQHEQQDATTFAQWGVDYLKYDLCSGSTVYPSSQLPVVYKLMGDALSATGRPILFSLCEYGEDHVWAWGASVGGNLWRTTSDIEDNWTTMSAIGFSQNSLAPYAGPGHWNDPDMLEIGNGGMTSDEYRTHMSLWSILAAPLIAGNDIRNMTSDTVSILLNSEVIAVDQDSAGIQGHQLSVSGNQEIWIKPLAGGSLAVGLFNRDTQSANMSVTLSSLGFSGGVSARDLWAHQPVTFQNGAYQAAVPAHGVVMLRIDPLP